MPQDVPDGVLLPENIIQEQTLLEKPHVPQEQSMCSKASTTLCGDRLCVDLQTDPQHCGSCTSVCAPNQECV
ncbi:MAG: hypothetical protein AAGJ35_14285, partial [Myxococcota bacterium]